MCKTCVICCSVSAAATWGFFAVLLGVLGGVKPLANAIWLTLLVSVAIISCPLMNPIVREKCTCKAKPKKKK